MNYPSRIQILGVPVDPYTMEQTVARTEQLLKERSFAHLIGVNADKVLQAHDDPGMRMTLEGCELLNADGASMLLAARWLRQPIPERVAGIDLMSELCALAVRLDRSVYLLGAKPQVVVETRASLERQFPGLEIAGVHDGYFKESEYRDIAGTLRESGAAIVFVGITSPKKEILIETFRESGLEAVCVGVGGSFDVISGNIRRAPRWVQQIQCEWLFRMLQEPRRLFTRYMVGNTRFLMLLIREVFRSRKGSHK